MQINIYITSFSGLVFPDIKPHNVTVQAYVLICQDWKSTLILTDKPKTAGLSMSFESGNFVENENLKTCFSIYRKLQ